MVNKEINNHFELKNVCRSAGLWYVGSFMLEYLKRREEWENDSTKPQFIEYMFNEYTGIDKDINGLRVRANSMIRIIQSRRVVDALNLVINANNSKLGCKESKECAKVTLKMITEGELKC